FILLGEKGQRYQLAVRSARFRRFFGCSLFIVVLGEAPFVAEIFLRNKFDDAFLFVPGIIILVAAFVRLCLLFPAIAVDAENAGWRAALHDTGKRFWRIFVTLLLGFLPGLVGVFVWFFAEMYLEDWVDWSVPTMVAWLFWSAWGMWA